MPTSPSSRPRSVRIPSFTAALLASLFVVGAATARAQAEGDGRTLAEFRSYLAGKMGGLPDEALDAIVKKADRNDDGTIDDKEFGRRMRVIQAVLGGAGGPGPMGPPPSKPAVPTADYLDREPTPVKQVISTGTTPTVLLVAADELAAAWLPFARWKTRQGLPTKIVTVRQIARGYEASSIEEKIRLCVREHIDQQGTRHVILGGDTAPGGGLVPGGPRTYHREEPMGIPTDLVYISPTNWDADGDGRYGEWKDDREAITYPDGSIGLGRIPARTVEDVQAFTAKVIEYESAFPTGEFARSMLITSTEPNSTPKVHTSWNEHISKSWKGAATKLFLEHDQKDLEDAERPSHANFRTAINAKGTSKIHIHGHGLLDSWILDGDEKFLLKDVDQLENAGAYPLITTVSCFTGEFDSDQDPCVVEAMLRAPQRGSVAIVAPIRTGKPHVKNPREDFRRMMEEGLMDGTTRTMTKYWVHGLEHTLPTGQALMKAKAGLAADARESASFHLCLCELNLLGDPTLAFRPDAPRNATFELPTALEPGANAIDVKTDAPGATVTLWQKGGAYLTAKTDKEGHATMKVELRPDSPLLATLSGPGLNTQTKSMDLAKAPAKKGRTKAAFLEYVRTKLPDAEDAFLEDFFTALDGDRDGHISDTEFATRHEILQKLMQDH